MTATTESSARGAATTPFIEMTSGYCERSRASLPRQGDAAPWRLQQHHGKDAPLFLGAPERDAALESDPPAPPWPHEPGPVQLADHHDTTEDAMTHRRTRTCRPVRHLAGAFVV